jgi:hypothetical protein
MDRAIVVDTEVLEVEGHAAIVNRVNDHIGAVMCKRMCIRALPEASNLLNASMQSCATLCDVIYRIDCKKLLRSRVASFVYDIAVKRHQPVDGELILLRKHEHPDLFLGTATQYNL